MIEHFYYGYEDILAEMKRVIKKDGYLFLTFPYMSILRKLKVKFNKYKKFKDTTEPDNFYQFALDYKKVLSDLEKIGFELKNKKFLNGKKGLKDEIIVLEPWIRKINQGRGFIYKFLRKILSVTLDFWAAHSVLLILKNKTKLK